jgi:two-component system, NtrC family, sensor kinase
MDVSQEPKFRDPLLHTTYHSPVYFRHNSEPYTTLALAGARDAGVSVAEVSLTFVWNVVSMIKVGEHGLAYVVDAEGRLIAHRNISMVLRNTDLSGLPQVHAARAAPTQPVQVVKDINGRELLIAYAKVEPTGWLLFVEIPFMRLVRSRNRAIVIDVWPITCAVRPKYPSEPTHCVQRASQQRRATS